VKCHHHFGAMRPEVASMATSAARTCAERHRRGTEQARFRVPSRWPEMVPPSSGQPLGFVMLETAVRVFRRIASIALRWSESNQMVRRT